MISGWVDQGGPVRSVVIWLNGARICELSPTAFRADLRDSGLGDGKRAFNFPLTGYLSNGLNVIAASVDGEQIFSKTIAHYHAAVGPVSTGLSEAEQLLEYSQARWKADEPPEGLTWGRRMDGRTLWSIYQEARRFVGTENVLEVGPGYGRLLDTALKLNITFANYIGVDLSEARITQLRNAFTQQNVRFEAGDVTGWRGSSVFDVILASATFEHLYPDCRGALRNLREQASPGAHVFIDFIRAANSGATFEPNGTYIRIYSEEELRAIFTECGYTVRDIVPCVLGEGVAGPVERSVVVAQAAEVTRG
jgi:SAM-dependent methyltransferase